MIGEDNFRRINKHVGCIIESCKPDGVLEVKYELRYDYYNHMNQYTLDMIFVVSKDNVIMTNSVNYINRYYNRIWPNKIKGTIMDLLPIYINGGEYDIICYDV